MREIKSELIDAKNQGIVVLHSTPHYKSLVKANRFLLLLASTLMLIVFVLGFLLIPSDNMLNDFKVKQQSAPVTLSIQNPVLSSEINVLKGQLVGLISGSIESKLRSLEESIRSGSVNSSLGTIQDLKNDVTVLRSYSVPHNRAVQNQTNDDLLKEVSQLKDLIYLTLSSCGLLLAAICGFWVKNYYRLTHPSSIHRAALGKQD